MSDLYDAKICVAICTPIPGVRTSSGDVVLDTVSPLWVRARMNLVVPTNFDFYEFTVDKMEVAAARNYAADDCLKHKPNPEFLFFLDYDVLLPPDALTKLFFRARCFPEYDIFAGVYCCKYQVPSDPLIYRGNSRGPFWNWTVGDLLTSDSHGITSTHMGLTLIRVSLFQKMLDAGIVHQDGTVLDDEPFFKTTDTSHTCPSGTLVEGMSEDIYFHTKASKIGTKILVDTSILAGHHDKRTGQTFNLPTDAGPVNRAYWMFGKKDNQKTALAVGVTNADCRWPDYTTHTLDVKSGLKVDQIQDLRLLNLPSNCFDMVIVNRRLEYYSSYEQSQVWSELARVLKPGGSVEFILTNLTWVGEQLSKKLLDESVLFTLYGTQHDILDGLRFHTHLFGFTSDNAHKLAECAGFTEIQVTPREQELVLKANKR